ncbi:MAG: Zn-dependent hydrolase [Succiniclasticum sp.]|uniref:Zn-dependent hydrolase n=1 Tax=Succiniclasticum sp. TaxID=2775030 RepID=UPI002A91DC89|nr:Zn-dependent hydrolase [Succiniclasticum sp.]MDY6291226.1 Zn-dependent hydrolase [Succiniclasticum sp.]
MLPVNSQRVADLIAGLAKFGRTEAGITRLAYSSTDKAAQMWLLKQIEYLDLEIREDVLGNLFLRKPGLDPALPPVACGSHLDTVIHGGAYDGMCGVVGALEAIHMLEDETLRRSIEVIVFRAEESSRFGYATIGSKLITGKATPDKFAHAAGKDGVTFADAVKEWGGNLEAYQKALLQPGAYKCFAEMHIEQGKVLEETKHQIGIVHNIAAPTRFKLHIHGMADHSGATPMGFRKDALVSAAKLILAVETAAIREKENGTVATVGVVEVDPGSINVVPGKVTLWVDLRGVDTESIQRTLKEIRQAVQGTARTDGITIEEEMLTSDNPVALDEALAAQSEEICREQRKSFLHMNSGAGHDAMHMPAVCPTTMLFIPCRGGISHNPAEFASNEDICAGIEVMAEILKREAK